jgi:hypothetical protein
LVEVTTGGGGGTALGAAQPTTMTNPAIAANAMKAKTLIFEQLITIGTTSTKCMRIRSARESY